jgi:signal transduction histidine kinase
MSPHELFLTLSTGLAGGAAGWLLAAWLGRRAPTTRWAEAAAEAFESALIVIDDGPAELVGGEETLAECADALGLIEADARQVIDALGAAQDNARRLDALFTKGEALALEVSGPRGAVRVEGRAAGALAWLRLSLVDERPAPVHREAALPAAERLAAFVDARQDPAWIAGPDGAPLWVNRAWLEAVGARSLEEALERGASLDRGMGGVARAAATQAERQEAVRWVSLPRGRRALRVQAQPLEGGGAAVWTDDVTEMEAAGETLGRHIAAHDLVLSEVGDAVAVFGPDRRLVFHNRAFADLWELEPAWLADGPGHGEIMDRLRQRRRLPETVDYALFKAEELARHEQLAPSPEAVWRLPGERTLRVLSQPHPAGGLTMLYCDITPELRLKTQFNHLIQVQRATLDKLTDAVAVFGADAMLKLHNEAFERFWAVSAEQLARTPDFDGVVDLCVPRLHDRQFWRDLKGRITDPDPAARAPVVGEVATAERRIVAYQSRPLPDGATLISFADVTDTRRLEGALSDRATALAAAERLKREFVASVSYELRTPLTTIVGYAELLERGGEALSARARDYVAAVRSAATQLARSIDNVLTMAEVDAGEMIIDIEDVDVGSLIAAAAERRAAEARAAGVEIVVADDTETGLIRGDPRRLAQVLDHLTENAVRHTAPGGTVTLSATRGLGEARLQVADNGRGFPFNVQAHIFDSFSGEDRGGSGLGLALVKALVELHGGWVALESEPGAGAAFTCHLPEAGQTPQGRPELF